MATGTPPKILPTLTEVVKPPMPAPAGQITSSPPERAIDEERLAQVLRDTQAELKAELEMLMHDMVRSQVDSLMVVVERHLRAAIHDSAAATLAREK